MRWLLVCMAYLAVRVERKSLFASEFTARCTRGRMSFTNLEFVEVVGLPFTTCYVALWNNHILRSSQNICV